MDSIGNMAVKLLQSQPDERGEIWGIDRRRASHRLQATKAGRQLCTVTKTIRKQDEKASREAFDCVGARSGILIPPGDSGRLG